MDPPMRPMLAQNMPVNAGGRHAMEAAMVAGRPAWASLMSSGRKNSSGTVKRSLSSTRTWSAEVSGGWPGSRSTPAGRPRA